MYVCICNAITDGQVGTALSQGCASVGEVFRHVGERPNCGKCVREVCRLVQVVRGSTLAPAGAV